MNVDEAISLIDYQQSRRDWKALNKRQHEVVNVLGFDRCEVCKYSLSTKNESYFDCRFYGVLKNWADWCQDFSKISGA